MAENVLSLTGVHKVYGQRVILDDVTLGLDAGDKVGLIGDNGAGKSTLLKMITGAEGKDGGVIAIRGGVKVAFLEQLPVLDPEKTARAVLAEPFAELAATIERYQHAAAAMAPDADALLDRIEHLGGWDWAHKAERAASEVGLTDLEQPVATMSGGQQKRVALARLMLEEPDLLLLDEPTNHLDAETIAWLEGYLAQSPATVLVVTHDRYFLERVVTKMAELRDGDIKVYAGRYQDYLAARATEEELQKRTTQRRSQILKAELDWARRSPSARTTKSRSRLDRAYALEDEVRELKAKGPTVDFQFADETPRLGKTILELDGVGKRYDGQPIVSDLSLLMRKGDRLGILGPNGSGKTTLLRMVTGEEEPDTGRVVRGGATRIAYFDQHRTLLDPSETVRRTVTPDGGDDVFFGGQSLHVASWLERFGFRTQHHAMRVASLSGGERNRLALARFLLEEANVLLLDEPTNDLDI
ncbi:MAG: ABC-F family ATP-binding cassette domain-containing protein, partial [Myxococcales bacterium]|nr:ABC-F family ATP-binding cassette domain-containing protein [Myxococcales bacterium]